MDPKELRGLMEAYSEVYAPQEEIDEAVKGASRHDTEMRKAAASERRSGVKNRLSASAGKANADKMERDVKYMDKLTKKNKNVVGLVSNEEVENYDEGYMPPTQKRADKMMKQVSKLRRTASEKGDFGHPEVEKKFKQSDKVYNFSKLTSDLAKKRDKDAKKSEFNEDIYDIILSHLLDEGYAETLEEAEWLMANVIDEEAIGIILGEEITSEKGKAKAAEMIAKRTTASGRAKSGQGDNVAQIKHIQRSNRDGLGGTPPNRKVAGSNWPKSYSGIGGTGNKAARRAAALKNEEYMDEAQEARNNPEKYEREQSKKYAPVRGERTPMPPRGNKRREDFEKWYAANVR
jgi:hypothetical protein